MNFKDSTYFQVYGDIWSFHKKYYDVQESDEYWDSVISDGSSVYKKYIGKQECEFAKQLVFCVIDELQRKFKEKENINKSDEK